MTLRNLQFAVSLVEKELRKSAVTAETVLMAR
jgi:hypothetical protein